MCGYFSQGWSEDSVFQYSSSGVKYLLATETFNFKYLTSGINLK